MNLKILQKEKKQYVEPLHFHALLWQKVCKQNIKFINMINNIHDVTYFDKIRDKSLKILTLTSYNCSCFTIESDFCIL